MNEKTANIPKATLTNQIKIDYNNKPSTAYLFGVDKIVTGVENENEQEIITLPTPDGESTYKKSRNKVEEKEIFNIHKQKHSNWIIIDLETGGRGWYPGSKEVIDIQNCYVYALPDDESEQLYYADTWETFDKLDLEYGYSTEANGRQGKVVFVKIKKDLIEGYVLEDKNKTKTYWTNK